MSEGLLKLRIPEQCKLCDATGSVRAEASITGDTVALRWCCRRCGNDWPVTARELTSRKPRPATTDRTKRKRRSSRG